MARRIRLFGVFKFVTPERICDSHLRQT